MDKNRIEGAALQGEQARNRKALVIKARWRKSGGCAVKECVTGPAQLGDFEGELVDLGLTKGQLTVYRVRFYQGHRMESKAIVPRDPIISSTALVLQVNPNAEIVVKTKVALVSKELTGCSFD